MAGNCNCEQPNTPSAVNYDVNENLEEKLIWLSEQTAYLLPHHASPHIALVPCLRTLLQHNGLISSSGKIKSQLIINALYDKFGVELMNEFGIGSQNVNILRQGNGISRLFQSCNGKTGNVLSALCIARLFVEDIRHLEEVAEALEGSTLTPIPRPFGRSLFPRGRARISKEAILTSLKESKGVIRRACKNLNVSDGVFRSDVMYHNITIPLSEKQLNRIGPQVIQDVRSALREGQSILSIREKFGLSKFSITLIRADDPELQMLHNKSKEEKKLCRSKDKLISFLDTNPLACRSSVWKKHTHSVETVMTLDSTWGEVTLPLPAKNTRRKKPGVRRDWQHRSNQISSKIQELVKNELEKKDRPSMLTMTRIKKAVGVLNLKYFPPVYRAKIEDILELSAESKAAFQTRVIRWAIDRYSELSIPISSNQLRRTAVLSLKELHECRALVIKFAQERGLGFHSRCSLSPLADANTLQG
ncbi:hypothetical protein [Pseudomonas arsenicoxydans]|nr:hypothetical protein [Pseudomonas arsenicoxydans]